MHNEAFKPQNLTVVFKTQMFAVEDRTKFQGKKKKKRKKK